MQRRMLKAQIEQVMAGEDPVGLAFDPKDQMIQVPSGNFYR